MTDAERSLEFVAARAALRPTSLAWALAEYQRLEGLDDMALVKHLALADPTRLTGLRLCLRPREDHFRQDVEAIARAYGVDADALAGLIRHVDALRAMADAPAGAAGRLLAARARKPKAKPKSKRRRRSGEADKGNSA